MSKRLIEVAQESMDLYYQQYKSNIDFFTLDDLVRFTGNGVSVVLMQLYKEKYAEIRADGTDSIVSFDDDWLSTQRVKLSTDKTMEPWGALDKKYMNFIDSNQSGIQSVSPVFNDKVDLRSQLERISLSSLWQLDFMPKTSRIFWAVTNGGISIFSNLECNVKEVEVSYIPDPSDENMKIPDGIIEDVQRIVIKDMREYANRPIKKTLDSNQNETLQTESNKNSLK